MRKFAHPLSLTLPSCSTSHAARCNRHGRFSTAARPSWCRPSSALSHTRGTGTFGTCRTAASRPKPRASTRKRLRSFCDTPFTSRGKGWPENCASCASPSSCPMRASMRRCAPSPASARSARSWKRRAIEARIGERQGQRTDLLPEKFPEVPEGMETRQYAAKRAGLGNEVTARQVEFVVDTAVAELVEVMDAGKVAPSQAAKIANRRSGALFPRRCPVPPLPAGGGRDLDLDPCGIGDSLPGRQTAPV